MRHARKWLAGIGIAACLAGVALGVAWAQVTISFNLTGNEIVNTYLPGSGATNPVPVYVLRGGNNHSLVAAGTTVTTQVSAAAKAVIATGAITTWNINLPTAPYVGQNVIIQCTGGSVTTLTITATLPAGVVLVGTNPTSCTSGGSGANASVWEYSVSANTWYRIL